MVLGLTTKCGHFSKLYANNIVWKNGKINKINTGSVVLLVNYFEDQDVMIVTVCNKIYLKFIKISLWIYANFLGEGLSIMVV